MLHLKFKVFHCMLLYASSLHCGPTGICTPSSYPLPGAKHKNQPMDQTPLLGFSLLGWPSAVGFPPLEVPTLLWDFSHSESYQISHSAAEISFTRRPKVCRYCWWDYPHSGTTPQVYQIAHMPNQTPRSWRPTLWEDMTDFKQANAKAIQAKSKQTFSFQRHMCVYFEKSFRSEYIWLHLTRVV